MAEGEVPIIDVSEFLGLDGTDLEEDAQLQAEAQAQFKLWFEPILARKKANQDKASMAVDEANGPKRSEPDPDAPDPKRRAGEGLEDGAVVQTVLPGNATTPASSDTAPTATATTTGSGDTGGCATPLQATPQKPKFQTEAAWKAAERKEKSDAMEAQLELDSTTAAVARATAVAAEFAAAASGNDIDEDLKDM